MPKKRIILVVGDKKCSLMCPHVINEGVNQRFLKFHLVEFGHGVFIKHHPNLLCNNWRQVRMHVRWVFVWDAREAACLVRHSG